MTLLFIIFAVTLVPTLVLMIFLVLSLRQWLQLWVRPILTCADLQEAPDGTAVIVVARSADGPLLEAPWSGSPCLAWEVTTSYPRDLPSGTTETVLVSKESAGLPAQIGSGGGTAGVEDSLARLTLSGWKLVGTPLLAVSDEVYCAVETSTGQERGKITRSVIPPDVEVVVVGTVTRDSNGRVVLVPGSRHVDIATVGSLPSVRAAAANQSAQLAAFFAASLTVCWALGWVWASRPF